MKKIWITLAIVLLALWVISLTRSHEKGGSLSHPLVEQRDTVLDLSKENALRGIPITTQERQAKAPSKTKGDNTRKDQLQEKVLFKGIVLKRFGPENIRTGLVFNKQPNGESAIWAQADNVTSTMILVLNGQALVSQPRPADNLVTAFVPRKLYASPGEYPLYVMDTNTRKRSNVLKFIVK